MIKRISILNFKKNKIKLCNTIICPLNKENGYYETKINVFPNRYFYVYNNFAIDLEMQCYYDYIDGSNYKNTQKIIKERFEQFKEKEELLFAFRSIEEVYINKNEKYTKIIEEFKKGNLIQGNEYYSSENYEEQLSKIDELEQEIKQLKKRK